MTHPAVLELKKIEGERFFRKFDDWLGLMLAAFERDDPRYMKILERYGPREEGKPHPADHFAHALGVIHFEMQKDNEAGVIRDHLGEIYESEGAAEREMAQLFTPMPLCELMARMIIDDNAPEKASIADPARGSVGRPFERRRAFDYALTPQQPFDRTIRVATPTKDISPENDDGPRQDRRRGMQH